MIYVIVFDSRHQFVRIDVKNGEIEMYMLVGRFRLLYKFRLSDKATDKILRSLNINFESMEDNCKINNNRNYSLKTSHHFEIQSFNVFHSRSGIIF